MPTSRFMLCSEGLVLDETTKNATIFNLFDTITPETFPTVIPRIVVMSNVQRDRDEPDVIDLRLRVKLGDALLWEFPVAVGFQDKLRSNIVITLAGILLTGPGQLLFTLERGAGEVIGQYDITINTLAPRATQDSHGAGS